MTPLGTTFELRLELVLPAEPWVPAPADMDLADAALVKLV